MTRTLNTQHIIIGGDFNLVMNKDLDFMNYKHLNNPKVRIKVLNLMETFNLVDIFRKNNANLKRYSWRRNSPIKQARFFPYI